MEKKDADREWVLQEYKAAIAKNKRNYLNGDVRSSAEYTYSNQIEDAFRITNMFYTNSELRIVSILKRTKVGMDGLMIELLKDFSTHPDNDFVVSPEKTVIITGMSNVEWEKNMKERIPSCFQDQVFHHGKLKSKNIAKLLENFENAVAIIDEIDTGDGAKNQLYKTIEYFCDKKVLHERNIRIVVVSATMKEELEQLNRWDDDIHEIYKMTIPPNYISHAKLIELGALQPFYQVNSFVTADKWIIDDIITHFGTDYRVNVIRTTNKNAEYIRTAAAKNKIKFLNHTSDERISNEDLTELFDNLNEHVIIAIKGFWRRANLIPNKWKIKLGAIMEYCGKGISYPDIQVQGLPGRLTGYWENNMLDISYKKPLIRTCIEDINKYEEWFNSPLEIIKGYKKQGNKKTFLAPETFKGVKENFDTEVNNIDVIVKECKTMKEATKYFLDHVKTKPNQNGPTIKTPDKDGFYTSNIRGVKKIRSYEEVLGHRGTGLSKSSDDSLFRCHACYHNVSDKTTLVFLVIHYPK
jgi:hypothetical protein